MRDIKRIPHIICLLGKIWYNNPNFRDLRFGQVVEILKSKLGNDDMFYVEDDDLIKLLEEMVDNDK